MALIALIGGSGLDEWEGTTETLVAETPFGPPSGPLTRFSHGSHELLFLPRHGPDHGIAPHRVNYRANLRALADRSADAVIAVNAVGSLDASLEPGALVVPDQLIDYTWGRAHSFLDGEAGPLDHVEFERPFDPAWRDRLLAAQQSSGVTLHDGGCIGVTQGPRLETAAEIQRLARDGCRLVGMTSQPEASLAREAGLAYACLAVVANHAAGVTAQTITLEAIARTLSGAMVHVRSVIATLLDQL